MGRDQPANYPQVDFEFLTSIPARHGDSINPGTGRATSRAEKDDTLFRRAGSGVLHYTKDGEDRLIRVSNQQHIIFLEYSRYIAEIQTLFLYSAIEIILLYRS